MGLSDLFAAANKKGSGTVDLSSDKDDVFRKLTDEVVRLCEENENLKISRQNAVAERKEAVNRARELEDTLRLKEGILDTLERRIENLEIENHRLLSVETELSLIREDQRQNPLSSSDASHRYDLLADIFSQLRDTLSCAVCYEPYVKDQAVSLLCGHSFCRPCFAQWELRHVEAWKLNVHQLGVYPGADCPECRSTEVRRGKVRIWALEETVRLVDRAVREIDKNRFTPRDASSSSSLSEAVPSRVARTARQGDTASASSSQESTRTTQTTTGSEPADATFQSSPSPTDFSLDSNQTSPLAPERAPLPPVSVESSTPASPGERGVRPTIDSSLARSDSSWRAASARSEQSPSAHDDDFAMRDGGADEVEQVVVVVSAAALRDTEDTAAAAAAEVDSEVEEARNLLRPRTPNPYVAVFHRR